MEPELSLASRCRVHSRHLGSKGIDPEEMESVEMDSVELDAMEVDSMEMDSVEMDSVEMDFVEMDSKAGVGAGDCRGIHLDRTSHCSGRNNLYRSTSGFDDGKRLG